MGNAAEQLKKFFTGLLRIQPGEGPKTSLMFGILMCVVGSFIMGRVARDSLFLSRYPVEYLPYLYIWVALGVSVLSYLYSRIADRFRRDRTLVATLLGTLAVTLAARISLYWIGDWFYPVLYVFVELAGTMLIIQSWTLANDVFTTREAKRLFALVGGGGVISAVVVGFSVRGLVRITGTEDLLFFSALGLVICLLLVSRLARTCREELLASLTAGHRPARARLSLSSDWSRIFANRHLIFVAILMVLLAFVMTFVDYQFKITARNSFLGQEDQLAGFFGLFWAITGVASCFIQFFLTGRVLERFGVLVSLLVLPFSLLVGTGAILIIPALWSASVLKGGDAIFRYTVNDSTMQLMYLPVPVQFRGRAKAFIDGIIRPLAIGLSGATLIWVVPQQVPGQQVPGALGWILLALLMVWIFFAIGTRRLYFQSLVRTLQTRRLHFSEVGGMIPDQAASKILRKTLNDFDESNVLHALEMMRYCSNVNWSDDLEKMVGHNSPRIRSLAVKLLGEFGSIKNGPQVFERLQDREPSVRASAVEAYCSLGKARAIRAITRFLDDNDSAVRAAAVVGLIRYGGLDGILSSAERLKKMLEGSKPAERATGARILGDIGVKNFYHPLLALLVDSDLNVRVAAIEAAGKMQSAELLPALVYRIEDPATRSSASRAVAAYGSQAVNLLERVLSNAHEPLATRQAVPSILGRVGDQQAMDVLLEHLSDPNESLRSQVLESVHRLRVRRPHLSIPADKAREAAIQETRNLYQQWYSLWDLKLTEDNSLLLEAMQHRRMLTLKRVFRLLGCFYPVRSVDAVYNNLSAPTRRIRANAIEVLDNMLDKDLKRLLIPLLDEALRDDLTEIGEETFGLSHRNREQQLEDLIADKSAWLSSCAIFTTAQIQNQSLTREVIASANSEHPLIRETSLAALRKLVDRNGLREAVSQHLRDPSATVRDYANWLYEGLQAQPE